MLCQKITWVFVAVLCLTIHNVNSVEVSCHVNAENQCVFEQNEVWDGKEEYKITNTDELAQSTTDVVLQAPFKTKLIPAAIFVKFPNLKSLTIKEVGLDTISFDDFENAKKLTHLYITKNNIATLKANSFTAAKNLAELDLSENQITKIEDAAFAGQDAAFAGLNELTNLNLSANKVANLDLASFTKYPKLTFLIVANMDFTFTAPFNSEEVERIVALNSPITRLDLSNNTIASTDLWRQLSIFPNLKIAYFTANKITHVDHMDEFKQLLPHVTELVMDKNPFDSKWLEEAKAYFKKVGVTFRF